MELDGWPGMIGHNWGAEHAERWIWMHGTAFDAQPDAWLDATIGRIKLGPWTTPWVANGCLSLDGVRHRLGGLGKTRAVKVDERPERATFTLPGDGIVVRGEVVRPARRRRRLGLQRPRRSAAPHRPLRDRRHDADGRAARPAAAQLDRRGGATYELGMREHDHGIPIQPFTDP